MGLKENLITEWIDKTIEYQDKKIYILDQFTYQDKEYLYGVDVETINLPKIDVVFLYKLKDDIFEHVESNELFEELALVVSGRLSEEMIKEDLKKYKNQLDLK